jgi:Co/Zn/Cd efflux system component
VDRIVHPESIKVNAKIMFITACAGLVANLIMGKILHSSGGGHSHGLGGA